ncbi:uncharacterized protein M421DRAFT_426116 [Didymella exigua CBS 183.55]|uniref:Uncharacterized protein n=1 Tax=Didymella exigua CBS 183.55 TaxID=1150837 RepID=A0A6A5R7F7_9PLEO|nr:uncharacterized protein M421DRAFT_426116 [Didymella exigua CBS 183.55]KAF1923140.1 hypothetical protein M421DRAFT_426116 [Didymella exigua CBS 183.55]
MALFDVPASNLLHFAKSDVWAAGPSCPVHSLSLCLSATMRPPPRGPAQNVTYPHASPLALIRPSLLLRFDPLPSLHLRPDQNAEADEDVEGLQLRCPRGATDALLVSVPPNDKHHDQARPQAWHGAVHQKLREQKKCRLTERAHQRQRLDFPRTRDQFSHGEPLNLANAQFRHAVGHETDQPELFRLFTTPDARSTDRWTVTYTWLLRGKYL